jgi:hypothetical protein
MKPFVAPEFGGMEPFEVCPEAELETFKYEVNQFAFEQAGKVSQKHLAGFTHYMLLGGELVNTALSLERSDTITKDGSESDYLINISADGNGVLARIEVGNTDVPELKLPVDQPDLIQFLDPLADDADKDTSLAHIRDAVLLVQQIAKSHDPAEKNALSRSLKDLISRITLSEDGVTITDISDKSDVPSGDELTIHTMHVESKNEEMRSGLIEELGSFASTEVTFTSGPKQYKAMIPQKPGADCEITFVDYDLQKQAINAAEKRILSSPDDTPHDDFPMPVYTSRTSPERNRAIMEVIAQGNDTTPTIAKVATVRAIMKYIRSAE